MHMVHLIWVVWVDINPANTYVSLDEEYTVPALQKAGIFLFGRNRLGGNFFSRLVIKG